MKDTIIKGSGNSRTIKCPPNIATITPDFTTWLNKLATEGVPIDLGPLNPAGVDVQGTDLTKANLLKDATASMYGLGPDAVPDDIFSTIVNKRTRIANGSYTGTGQGGKIITFGFLPKLFLCKSRDFNSSQFTRFYFAFGIGNYMAYFTTEWGNPTAILDTYKAVYVTQNGVALPTAFNFTNYKYDYVAFG